MALLRLKTLYGVILGMICFSQTTLALEAETIPFDSLASNLNSRVVGDYRGRARIDNLGFFYSLAHLEQRGPKFHHKTVTSFSSNIYTSRIEPVEIFVTGGTCASIIVGYYANEQATSKYELPLGIDPSQSLTNTFKYLNFSYYSM